MKKIFSVFFICLIFISVFSCSAFADNTSWQASYFNKLVEIGEKPGFIKSLLTGKDSNGFYSKQICYALNDYNQDGVPELVVYGINSANEAGDNYQIYTYDKEKVKKFEIKNYAGPYGEDVSFSDQPYWPYYTNFFFLPDGYTNKKTNDLVWVMKTTPESYGFWAIAGTPCENENIFEVDFDFQNMVAEIVPIVFAEKTEPNKYRSDLESWKENHELSVQCDEYGRVIPSDCKELWKQLMKLDGEYSQSVLSAEEIPEIETKNKILIFRNKIINNETFWIVGFYLAIIAVVIFALLSIRLFIKRLKNNK